jgi:hypothetical protein
MRFDRQAETGAAPVTIATLPLSSDEVNIASDYRRASPDVHGVRLGDVWLEQAIPGRTGAGGVGRKRLGLSIGAAAGVNNARAAAAGTDHDRGSSSSHRGDPFTPPPPAYTGELPTCPSVPMRRQGRKQWFKRSTRSRRGIPSASLRPLFLRMPELRAQGQRRSASSRAGRERTANVGPHGMT